MIYVNYFIKKINYACKRIVYYYLRANLTNRLVSIIFKDIILQFYSIQKQKYFRLHKWRYSKLTSAICV